MQELCRRSENVEPQRLCAIHLSASQEAALLGGYSPLLLRKGASPLLLREGYHLEGGRTFLPFNAGNLILGRRESSVASPRSFCQCLHLRRGGGIGQGLWSCRRTACTGCVRAIERSGTPRESRVRGATASQRPPPADSLCLTSSAQTIAAINATRARPVRVYRESSQCPAVVGHSMLRRPALPACPVRHAT
jgi:hypothetical protein